MRSYSIWLFVFLALPFVTAAQSNTVTIHIGDPTEVQLQSKAYLFGHFINRKTTIDSAMGTNVIALQFPEDLPSGLFNVMLYTDLQNAEGKYQRLGFDIILTGENADLAVEVMSNGSLGNLSASAGANRDYYAHFNESIILEQKEKVLETAISEFPKTDPFFAILLDEFKKVKSFQTNFSQSDGTATNETTLFYLKAQQAIKKQAFDQIEFDNPLLQHSPFVPIIVWNYLDEIQKELSPTLRIKETIKRLSIILPFLKADEQVFESMLSEIVSYYEKQGLNEVVVYLNEQHLLPDVCENTDLTNRIEEKNSILKRLLMGEAAPDIDLPSKRKANNLYKVQSNRTLLIFWESTCPHCQDVTEELTHFYQKDKSKEFEIIAFALDTSETSYTEYLAANKFEWLNYSDFNGWDSPAARAYNVVSTPSMFLLDKNKKIIGRPRNFSDIKILMSED